jgi:hypothetical protein
MVKDVPGARRAWTLARSTYYRSELKVLGSLSPFVPNSSGNPKQLLTLALLDAQVLLPRLEKVLDDAGVQLVEIAPAEEFPRDDGERAAATALGELFRTYGSDKSGDHDYHLVYGPILARSAPVTALLEVGLGTNNEDVVSNMTAGGRPGASLRAFRDFLPQAQVYGADVDRRVLFEEERISTFFVDQTDPQTFVELEKRCGSGLDVVIDDGLHSPAANLTVLQFGLRTVRVGGFVVIEDIREAAVPLWRVVGTLLRPRWRCDLIRARWGFVFVAQRAESVAEQGD